MCVRAYVRVHALLKHYRLWRDVVLGFPFLLGQQEYVVQTIILHYRGFVTNKISLQTSAQFFLFLGRELPFPSPVR